MSQKTKIFLILLGLVVLLLAGFELYAKQQRAQEAFEQDKVRFTQINKQLATTYAAISNKIGKPDTVSIERGCAYGALKYARGDLNCGIGYKFAYGVHSEAAADQQAKILYLVVKRDPAYKIGYSEVNNPDDVNGGFFARFIDNNEAACDLKYFNSTGDEFNGVDGPGYNLRPVDAPYVAEYWFGCTSGVTKAVYQIEKNS